MAQLKERLHADLTAAMKSKDAFTMSVLRMALAAIGNEEVAGDVARELTDAEEEAIVARAVRQRRESADVYAGAGRDELAKKENAEADLLATYLPKPLSAAEVDALVAEEVARVPDKSPRAMGAVIKAVNARAAGRADGTVVAARVKAALGLG